MLVISGVHKSYLPGTPVLRELSLEVGGPSLAVVSGQVESGTTTLLRLIAGLERADSGSLSVLGHDPARLRESSLLRLRQRMGLMPQEIVLDPAKSVGASIGLPLSIAGLPRSEIAVRVQAICDRLALGDLVGRATSELSTGQRRLVSLARAAVADPELMLLDQPTSDLDEARRERVSLFLKERADAGVLVFVASRDPLLLGAADHRFELAEGAVRDARLLPAESVIENIVPFPVVARAGGISE